MAVFFLVFLILSVVLGTNILVTFSLFLPEYPQSVCGGLYYKISSFLGFYCSVSMFLLSLRGNKLIK